jgi:hypothetical protein
MAMANSTGAPSCAGAGAAAGSAEAGAGAAAAVSAAAGALSLLHAAIISAALTAMKSLLLPCMTFSLLAGEGRKPAIPLDLRRHAASAGDLVCRS